MFDALVLENDGRRDLGASNRTQLRADDYHYAMLSFDEAKVLLQANLNNRSGEYGPKNDFPPSVSAARWWSYLNRRLGQGPMSILITSFACP